MRRRRSYSEAEPDRGVTASSELKSSVEENRASHDVDSRAYAFAYLTTNPAQLPADFPVDEKFEHALFLPQEIVPRFKTPRYVPRLLLEGQDTVTVYSHPRCAPSKTTISFSEISHIELERFLADCSLIIFTRGRTIHVPFHGRDREFVEGFLKILKRRLLSCGPSFTLTATQRHFGPRLDYKFEQIEMILEIERKSVLARFFVPPTEVIRPRLLRKELSWKFGSEVILTRTELHVFSDDKDGYRQLYGFRALWVPMRKIASIRWEHSLQSVTIRLLGDLTMQVPVPEELRSEAERFTDFASYEILDRRATS